MLICILDGHNITDKEMLHNSLADSLRFPDWYGRNLDALYDCLSDIQEETEIRLQHAEAFAEHLGRYAESFMKAVNEACRENPGIHFIIDIEKSLTDCQRADTDGRYRNMDFNHIKVNTQNSIRIKGSKILYFDPFQVEECRHDADLIFITHEHYDHFDPDLITPESMKKKALSKSGIAAGKCVFFKPGETDIQDGMMIQTVPAYNRLKPFHPKMKKWLGYVVKLDEIRYYVAGDTDVNEEIRKVQCDVALVPIGGHYTMDKKQAAEFIAELKPGAVIPTHYGSIIGNKTDGQEFANALKAIAPDIRVELKIEE